MFKENVEETMNAYKKSRMIGHYAVALSHIANDVQHNVGLCTRHLPSAKAKKADENLVKAYNFILAAIDVLGDEECIQREDFYERRSELTKEDVDDVTTQMHQLAEEYPEYYYLYNLVD